jgi:uncharacterized membrane protein
MAIGALVSSAATAAGLMAASIAVCGFLAHAKPAISGKSEAEMRTATVVGGLFGFLLSILVVVLSSVARV